MDDEKELLKEMIFYDTTITISSLFLTFKQNNYKLTIDIIRDTTDYPFSVILQVLKELENYNIIKVEKGEIVYVSMSAIAFLNEIERIRKEVKNIHIMKGELILTLSKYKELLDNLNEEFVKRIINFILKQNTYPMRLKSHLGNIR